MSSTRNRPKLASATRDQRHVAAPSRLTVLDGKQRRTLRGLAHELQPVLQVGKAGLSKALLEELDRALEAHELVKIRLLRECPTEMAELVDIAERSLCAAAAGTVGNVAVLYRARVKNPTLDLSKPKPSAGTKATSAPLARVAKRPSAASAPAKALGKKSLPKTTRRSQATKTSRKRTDWE